MREKPGFTGHFGGNGGDKGGKEREEEGKKGKRRERGDRGRRWRPAQIYCTRSLTTSHSSKFDPDSFIDSRHL